MRKVTEQLLKESERRYRLIRSVNRQVQPYEVVNKTVSRYITLTFVTTGNRPGADRIIQIGAMKYEHGQLVAQFNTLINPKRFIPLKVTRETGIANAFVENAPTMERKIDEFLAFIEGYPIVTVGASTQMAFFYELERQLEMPLISTEVIDLYKLIRKSLPFFRGEYLEQLNALLIEEQEAKHALERCEKYHQLYELYIQVRSFLR